MKKKNEMIGKSGPTGLASAQRPAARSLGARFESESSVTHLSTALTVTHMPTPGDCHAADIRPTF